MAVAVRRALRASRVVAGGRQGAGTPSLAEAERCGAGEDPEGLGLERAGAPPFEKQMGAPPAARPRSSRGATPGRGRAERTE